MSDIIDDANDRAEKWLNAQIEEHQYQMANAAPDPNAGRCRNCHTKTDDGRNYCDEHCRDDHWKQVCADRRRGRKA